MESDWSETWNLDLLGPCDACSVPTQVRPSDGKLKPCGVLVDIEWSGNCEEYYCEVWWTGGGGNSGWTRNTIFRSPMPPTYEGGTVYWKVKGRNACEAETAWSATRSFIVAACPTPVPAPPPPVLWDPPNGAHFPRGTQVGLRWRAVSGASVYAVAVWNGGYYWSQDNINNVEYPSPYLNTPGMYEWHVAAKYPNSEYSVWSESRYFYID